MRNSVDAIVQNAIEILSKDHPDLCKHIWENQTYIAAIRDDLGRSMVLVDFETTLEYEPVQYQQHAQNLYTLFKSYDKFYEVG